MKTDLYQILEDVRDNKISVAEAELLIKKEPFAELDFAMLDTQRKNRQGAGEVVYGAGKTPEQIKAIVETLKEHSDDGILITKLDKDKQNALKTILNADIVKRDFEGNEVERVSGEGEDGSGAVSELCPRLCLRL